MSYLQFLTRNLPKKKKVSCGIDLLRQRNTLRMFNVTYIYVFPLITQRFYNRKKKKKSY